MSKTLITKLLAFVCISIIFTACASESNSNENNIRGVNQNNNLQAWGFALMVENYIFFADSTGIHRSNDLFESIETLVFNENYLTYLSSNLSAYSGLQYYNDSIFFLDRSNSTIYSMCLSGNDITPILKASDIGNEGTLGEFIVTDGTIYFHHFVNGTTLYSFDLETENIINLSITTSPLLSISPDGQYLLFAHNFVTLTGFNFDSGDVRNKMPINFETLSANRYVRHITSRTVINNSIAFASPHAHGLGSRIFIIDRDGYAEEIYFSEDSIFSFINAINDWIYFTVMQEGDVSIPIEDRVRDIHLYRVRSNGGNLELVYKNIAHAAPGIPTVTISIFSEDIILFRTNPTHHTIYALMRNNTTDELVKKAIN